MISGKINTLTNLFQNLAALKAEEEAEIERLEALERAKAVIDENAAPLDYSFFHLAALDDADKEDPRIPQLGHIQSPRGFGGRFAGRCLRLNNNMLTEVSALNTFVGRWFINPDILGWIDLSFNELPNIDPVFLSFKKLEILYLHGNKIKDLREVEKLASVKTLRKLTLHGNDVEKTTGYRYLVLSLIPWLRNFDFSPVTKNECRSAQTYRGFVLGGKRRRRRVDADD